MFESLFPKIFIGFVILFLLYGLVRVLKGNPNWGITIGEIHTPFGHKNWSLMGDGKIEKTETGIFKTKNSKRK